ncbi:MAG: phosphatidylserine decarboxylase family protein [Deltaproteobacteria bacterium]|nr:phosphatidylserine decarboxylase family protein [Deltaproteobacteria bacterium]
MSIIARAGYPVIGAIAIIAALCILISLLSSGAGQILFRILGGLGVFFFLFSLYFFRDPERIIPTAPELLLSPADGAIIDISEIDEPVYLKTRSVRVSIFMSVFNVHVNRAPMDGTVEFLHYNPGKFISAFKDKASEENESIFAGIKGRNGNVRISMKFIAGLIARRIIFYKQVNDAVTQGERINMIRFGSRVNIFCPIDSVINVKKGDTVTAGMTVIAVLKKGV